MPSLPQHANAAMTYSVGQEWTDGQYNYIIVKVEDVLTADENRVIRFVTVFDGEGVVDRLPAVLHAECIEEMELEPVVEPPLPQRLAAWRRHHPSTFPL
jgi:hypothetical protein